MGVQDISQGSEHAAVQGGVWASAATKAAAGLIHTITFSEPVDIIKIFMLPSGVFRETLLRLRHAVLRGSSYWSVGERELFGAFTRN
jgi:hypothetical protein